LRARVAISTVSEKKGDGKKKKPILSGKSRKAKNVNEEITTGGTKSTD